MSSEKKAKKMKQKVTTNTYHMNEYKKYLPEVHMHIYITKWKTKKYTHWMSKICRLAALKVKH